MALNPPPIQSSVTDPGGRMGTFWLKWFREVYAIIGATLTRSLSAMDLALTTAEANITTLQATDVTHSAQIVVIQADIEDLKVGRQL